MGDDTLDLKNSHNLTAESCFIQQKFLGLKPGRQYHSSLVAPSHIRSQVILTFATKSR